jgi:hypothetical protein
MTTDVSTLHEMQVTSTDCPVNVRCKTSGMTSSRHGAVHTALLHLFHESATAIYCPLGRKSACRTFRLNLIRCNTVPRWKFKNEHGVILTSITTNKSASSRERMPCRNHLSIYSVIMSGITIIVTVHLSLSSSSLSLSSLSSRKVW